MWAAKVSQSSPDSWVGVLHSCAYCALHNLATPLCLPFTRPRASGAVLAQQGTFASVHCARQQRPGPGVLTPAHTAHAAAAPCWTPATHIHRACACHPFAPHWPFPLCLSRARLKARAEASSPAPSSSC